MTKRWVDIQDELLREAREVLGTSSIEETVTVAPERAVRDGWRGSRVDEKALERFAAATHDLADAEVMGSGWR